MLVLSLGLLYNIGILLAIYNYNLIKNMKKIVYSLLAFSPLMALAQVTTGGVGTIDNTATSLAGTFNKVVNILIPAFFGLAVIYFFYGVAKYILAAGDPDEASKGKSIMIYGVIALAVMATLYGLINFLTQNLGISGSGSITLPKIPAN